MAVLTEYRAVLNAVVSHNTGESKQAHKALTAALKEGKSATYLIYLAKVYMELGVHEVLDVESAFAKETQEIGYFESNFEQLLNIAGDDADDQLLDFGAQHVSSASMMPRKGYRPSVLVLPSQAGALLAGSGIQRKQTTALSPMRKSVKPKLMQP